VFPRTACKFGSDNKFDMPGLEGSETFLHFKPIDLTQKLDPNKLTNISEIQTKIEACKSRRYLQQGDIDYQWVYLAAKKITASR
jgi:hypothetical protein